MKEFIRFVTLVALLFIPACTNQSQTDTTQTDKTASAGQLTSQTAEVALSERLVDLGLTTSRDWRGISLGDSVATVRATEKAKLFESDAHYLGYTLEFPNLESVDILYQLDANQTVNSIDVDLYLNDVQSATAYQRELASYFDARYKLVGTPNTWLGEKRETITLQNVSKGKDYGLKIKIFNQKGV